MATQQDGVNWAVARIGQRIDYDKYYGAQCMDFVIQFCVDLFGWRPFGNAIALVSQPIPAGWQRIQNSASFVPQPGDIAIWGLGSYATYGHTGIIVSANMNSFVSIDQNWFNASLTNGSPAAQVNHTYNGFWGVLRPPYGQNGGNMAIIQNAENWYQRCNKTHVQTRGRELGRDVFAGFVGKDFLTFAEACEDNPEADAHVENAKFGEWVRGQHWEQQIYDLQDALSKRPTQAQMASIQAQLKTLADSADQSKEEAKKAREEAAKLTDQANMDKQVADTWLRRLGQYITKYLPGGK